MSQKKSVSALFLTAAVLASGAFAQDAPQEAQPASENNPPSLNGIPGESIQEGGKFAPIKLDEFVSDPEDAPEALKWKITGNKNLVVKEDKHVVTIQAPNQYWNGSEDITFTVTDTKGASSSETVNFTVESVNNPPVVSKIPDQTIDEGKKFAPIKLDNYVEDVDHPKDQIAWEYELTPIAKDQAEGELSVEISKDRIANVVVPDTNWYGAYKITFIATDGEYASAKTDANFTVNPINDAPIVQKAPDQTINEKEQFEPINLSDLVSDVDDDVSKIKWSVSGGKDLKVKIDKYGVAEVVIPNENWNGPTETFEFKATDPKGASASFKTSFTVKSVNDAPEFVEMIPDQTIQEKQQFQPIDLSKYVKDIDHKFEQLKWEFSGNKDLKVQLAGKTAKILIPNALWNGSETINFKVTDPEGASAEAQANFTVESVNDVPQFVKQIPAQTIDEKKQFAQINLDEFVKDDDHKKEELSWEVEVKSVGKEHPTGPLFVNIDEKHVAKVEIPDTYWNGAAVATFKVIDPEGAEAKQEVKLTVRSINDLPVFKKIPDQTIEEKAMFDGFALDDYLSDADHDLSQLKISVSGNKELKVNVDNNRMVSIQTPDINWNGSETVTFTATDPDNGKASATVKFTVKSINDAPVMKDIPSQTIKEKEEFKPVELDKFVSDLDHAANQLKWTITGNKDIKVSLDANRKASFKLPSKYWHGSEAITFKVTDPEGASDERTVNFTVESVNDAPEFVKKIQDQTIKEKSQFKTINLGEMVKDADHKLSDLTVAVDVKPAPGVKNTQGDLQVNLDAKLVATIAIPNKFWNGANVVTFTVTDPEGAKTSESATFTVQSVNDAPELKEIKSQTIDEKAQFAPINLAELVSDADHSFDQLKWTISGNKDLKVNIDKAGTATIVIPNQLWNGSEKITFTVTDPEGASAKQTAVFTVKSINDAPVMKDIPSQTIKEKGQFKAIKLDDYVKDLDHPNSKLKWNITGNKDLKFKIDPQHEFSVIIPDKYWHGSETFVFEVVDPEGAKDSRKVTFTVESVNDAPEFVKKINDQTIDEKKQFAPIKLAEIVKDPDHKIQDLTWAFNVKGAKNGLTVKVDPKTLVATVVAPDKYWNGSNEIEFVVTDPEGGKASQTATFTVKSINDAPVLAKINDQIIVEKEEFKDINLAELVKDPDDSFKSLKWTITGNKDLKISISKDGVASIKTPNKLWNGSEKVTFMVTDPAGASSRQTVQLTAKSVNDPPVMKDIPGQTIKEKQEFKDIELDDYVSDLDHPKNKLKWDIQGNKVLKFAMTPSHKVSIKTPNKYWYGKETVTFTVMDPEGAKDSRTVTFEVISVNDPPVFVRELKDQTIDEKKQFAPIKLDDMIKDPDHKLNAIQWTYKVSKVNANPAPKKGKKGKKAADEEESSSADGLTVNIDNNHVAKIVIPNKYWNGAAKITFTATDPEGAKASSSATFTVKSINDIPVISANAPKGETIREGGTFKTIDLSTLATDADHSAKQLKWSFQGNRQLKVTLNKDNTVQVKVPDAQWHGKETITFTVTDPEGGKASHKMDFVVTEVNDPPVLSKIPSQKIKEKETFKPVALDEFVKDPDNKPSEMKWNVSGNKNLKAEITSARKLVVSAPNKYFWCKPETLTLTVSDPKGASASTMVTFEITSVNDAPVLKDIPSQTIKEKAQFKDIPLDNFVHDADHRNSQLTWTAVVKNADAPAPAPKKKAKKGKKAKEEPKAEEKKADDLTVTIDDKHVAHIAVPNKYWNGKRSVTFTVADPEGAKDSKTINLEVLSVNDPPTFDKIPNQTIKEKEHFAPINLLDYVKDPDHSKSALTFEVSQPRGLKASINKKNQLVVTTPDKYWNGSEKINVTVRDPEGGRDVQQLVFTVTPVNDAPVLKAIPGQTIKEKERFAPIDLSKYVSDPDNRPNEITWVVSGNKALKFDIRGSRVNITTPDEYWNGTETVVFTAKDPAGAGASVKSTFKVTPVNDPPHFNKLPVQQIKEKNQFSPIDLSKLVVDPDNDASDLSWSIDDGEPAKKDKRGRMGKAKRPTVKHPLSYDISDAGVLTVTIPNKYWNGKDQVKVNAYDPSGEKASLDIQFVVIPVNDPPVLSKIPDMVTNEGKKFAPIKLDKYVKDPDHKPNELRWSISGNRHLEVMINGGREAIVRPSRADWFGKETITFIVKDPAGAVAKVPVNFEVKHVNAVPEIRPIHDVTMREDANKGVLATLKLDQYVRDRDNSFNELKWTITGNKKLVVDHDKARNIVTIKQPYEHWNGAPETITFTVTDPEGASAKTSAKFTVIPVNDPPVAMSKSYQTKEGETLNVNAKEGLLEGAFDPDGKLDARVSLVRRPQNGKVEINEKDGSFVYKPNKGFYGLDEFGFKLTDKEGASSKVETAEINVNFKMKDIRNSGNETPKSSSSSDAKKGNKRRR
ncbi:MAG: tandem-95 repeat protein [Fibrobacter sp.]|nr:tandem-95 repeat protein [Fibrobacter sp.]